MLVLILFLASLASWAQIPTGGAAGVGGAGDLTTAGAIPYVVSAGTLGQDSSLYWNSTTGTIEVGTNASSGDKTGILIRKAATNPLSSGGAHAVRDESTYTATGTGGYASYDSIPVMSGALAHGHLHSFQARPNYSGSTSVDQVAGHTYQITHSGAGTVTSSAGLVVDDALGAGPITTQYGLLVKPLTRGTGNYGVYVQGANPSYFGGNVQSGGTVQGTAMRISSGFTTYGGVITNDASGNFLANPNMTIVNGVLTLSNSSRSIVYSSASSGGLELGTSSGVVQINNGTAGTYRDITFRIAQWRNGAEGTCDATTRGQVVMVQGGAGVADTFRVCAKDNADAYAWTALY